MRLFLLLLVSLPALGQDPRYCGPPKRNAAGEIVRSQSVLRQFQRLNPCPATGMPAGPCPGWAKDHVRPLASCGCDSISNLQWLPTEMWRAKSLWERKVYTCQAIPAPSPSAGT